MSSDYYGSIAGEIADQGAEAERPWLTEAEYAATLPERADRVVADINERMAGVLPEGMRFGFEPAGDAEPQLLATTKAAATFMVPTALMEDFAGMGDLLGQALRGEIELKPPPEPRYHRCLACWLVSLLPGHDRCTHGRLDCDDCWEDAR